MKTYLCVYLGATALAVLGTPVAIRVAAVLRILDRPGLRKIHRAPIPRIGGAVIFAASLAMTASVLALDNRVGDALWSIRTQLVALLAGASLVFVTGLIDDIRGLRVRTKLTAQVAAAAIVCAAGVRIDAVAVGRPFMFDLGPMAWPLTILWIVGLTNAVNLIDGLDGLAAGICAVACAVVAVFSICYAQPVMAVIMLSLVGSLTGFLLFNFSPARIFLGDGGTYLLGFALAAGSVLCTIKSATVVGLALPALALGVPIFDTLLSIVRRGLQRRSVFAPDRSHIHHRLVDMGLQHHRAVLLIYGVTVVAAGAGLLMIVTHGAGQAVVFACVLLFLMLVFRSAGSVRLSDAIEAVRRNRAIAHEARQHRRQFEDAQLRLGETRTFAGWWRAVCQAADGLGLDRLWLYTTNRDGTPRSMAWRAPTSSGGATMGLTVPVPQRRAGVSMELRADVAVGASLESAGRRAALLSRLVGEHSVAHLPRAAGPHRSNPAPSIHALIAARIDVPSAVDAAAGPGSMG